MTNLDNVIWGDFKLGDLFDVSTSKGIDKTKVKINEKSGTFDFIGRTPINNGVQGYLEKLDFEPNKKDTFSVIQIGENVAQFRKREWYSSQNIFLLSPNNSSIVKNKLFILTVLNKTLTKYSGGYSSYPTKETLKNDKITLPVLANGDPDYDFMEEFIKDLETEQFSELDNHLETIGLSDTKLTQAEQKALDDFDSLTWGDFKIGDLFEKVKTSAIKKKASELPNKPTETHTLACLTAGLQNQGLSKYIEPENKTILKDVITISANGANTGATFYQTKEFTILQDAYAIELKDKNSNSNKKVMFFYTSCITKAIYGRYDWSNKAGWERVKKDKISLPILKNGDIDYKYMETYIKAIEKLTINDVVDLTTKKVV